MRRILYCLAIISAAQVGSAAIMPSPSHIQECPTIIVNCPAEVPEPGKPETFTAQVKGTDPKVRLTYRWTVSTGTIMSGQGTSAITVDTAGTWVKSITAMIEVDGLDSRCGNSATCTRGAPAVAPVSCKFDEYGDIAASDEKVRLDNFANQLQSEPGSQGYIIVYDKRTGEAQSHADRAKNLLVSYYAIDPARIVTINGGVRQSREVELWISPVGANPLTPNKECPTVTVDCPTGVVEMGTPVTFTANIGGADPQATLTYHWSVSTGTIMNGQGTTAIIVDQTRKADQSITATIEVGGLGSSCPHIASCSIMPGLPALSRKFDEYGKTAFKDEKARLNKFAKQLRNEPQSRGYIITYGRRSGRAGEAQAHANHAKSYLVRSHGIDPERIVTVDGGFRANLEVELWLMPMGASPPKPTPTISPDKVQTNKGDVKRNW